jgi:hypothetical protein
MCRSGPCLRVGLRFYSPPQQPPPNQLASFRLKQPFQPLSQQVGSQQTGVQTGTQRHV